jgi:hypothetical protein
LLRGVAAGLGTDRLVRVVVEVQLPVGADVGCAAFPVEPVQRVLGHRAERADGPRGRMLREMRADPVLAGVHRAGQVGDELPALAVGELGHGLGPRQLRQRDQRADPLPDPGIEHGGNITGTSQQPALYRLPDHLAGIQTCGLGGAQASDLRPEQDSNLRPTA